MNYINSDELGAFLVNFNRKNKENKSLSFKTLVILSLSITVIVGMLTYHHSKNSETELTIRFNQPIQTEEELKSRTLQVTLGKTKNTQDNTYKTKISDTNTAQIKPKVESEHRTLRTLKTEFNITDEHENKKIKEVVFPKNKITPNFSFYCIQVSSSKTLKSIAKLFNALASYPYARIEKIGKYYTLRIGFFEIREKAKLLEDEIRRKFKLETFVRKCAYRPERWVNLESK